MKKAFDKQRSIINARCKWTTILSVVGLVLIAFGAGIQGQSLDSKRTIIVGHIMDELGAMIGRTEILAMKEGKIIAKTESKVDGKYELDLLPGVYTLEFRGGPYRTFEIERYVVPIGVKNWRLDICLECPDCERLDLPGI